MPQRIAHSLRGELRSSLDEVCVPENSRICRYTPCSLNTCSLALFAVPFNPGLDVPHAPLPVSCTEYGIRSHMQRLSRLSRSLIFFFFAKSPQLGTSSPCLELAVVACFGFACALNNFFSPFVFILHQKLDTPKGCI